MPNFVSFKKKKSTCMKYIARIFCALALLSAASCTSYKQIQYLQDLDEAQKELSMNYEPQIKPGDRLNILVSGQDKTVTAPYNLTLFETSTNGVSSSGSNPESAIIPYIVDEEGCILFPKLGQIKVAGMTQQELKDYLMVEIGKDVKDPIVYVSIKNFKIHVMGEVRSPGTYTIESDTRTTIFQALSKAGDLSLTAQREGVIVLRDEDGVQKHYTLDLRSTDVFDSPAYFVQQNDVIMVQPSPMRVATATAATGLWSTALSSITTMIAIITFLSK